jgi:hypothetical protein
MKENKCAMIRELRLSKTKKEKGMEEPSEVIGGKKKKK